MKKNTRIYLHIIISVLLIPAFINGGVALKAILLMYSCTLVMLKDATYLPALIIQASYMTNSFSLYFVMIFLSIIHFRKIKDYNLQRLLLLLLLFLPMVVYYTFLKVFILGLKPGPALVQFEFYFSLFAFFYGVLISETFDKRIIKALVFTFFLLLLLNFITKQLFDIPTIRMLFFIIPFSFSLLIYFIVRKFLYKTWIFIFLILGILSLIINSGTTFTIISLFIFSSLILFFYFARRKIILKRITGIGTVILLIIIVMLAIRNNSNNVLNTTNIARGNEIESLDDLTLRFKSKYFADRGTLWAGAWNQIKNDKSLLPPIDIGNIILIKREGIGREFEYHSHNIVLELLRTTGIIMGIILSLMLIKILLLGRKIFEIYNVNSYLIILTSVSISGLLIGSTTGVYPLLSSFAICGLGIPGIAFGLYKSSQRVTT